MIFLAYNPLLQPSQNSKDILTLITHIFKPLFLAAVTVLLAIILPVDMQKDRGKLKIKAY
jgi:hypothetical protein